MNHRPSTPSAPPMRGRAAVAALFAALSTFAAPCAMAHEGQDHDPEPVAVSGAAPRRLPDGTILLPKASQRQLQVRTLVAERGAAAQAVELAGRVAIDPAAGGRVQAALAGRVEAGPRGLPVLGQPVARGQWLATLRPTLDPLARAARDAQLAELRAAHGLAQRRATRLRELSDSVPRKEIEAAESELASLGARLDALARGLAEPQRLLSPVSGVVAAAHALPGTVVEPGALLFEIVDPARLLVEVAAYDPAIVAEVAGGSVAVGGRVVPLAFVGAGRMMREQSVPMVFRAGDAALSGLAVGQPLPVSVRLRSAAKGVALPAAAVVRSPANEPVVWVKMQAERFEPRRVRTRPLDAARLLVTDGLAGGERVVVDGAPLLAQIR